MLLVAPVCADGVMSVSDTCSPQATAVPRARLAALNQISADERTRVPSEAPVVFP